MLSETLMNTVIFQKTIFRHGEIDLVKLSVIERQKNKQSGTV